MMASFDYNYHNQISFSFLIKNCVIPVKFNDNGPNLGV